MTKKNKLFIFIFFILITFISITLIYKPKCIIKKIFNIPCPGCGLTRAAQEILKLNLIKAEYYNILSIPITIFIVYIFIIFIKDIIKKGEKTQDIIIKIFTNYYKLIILMLVISEILNIIHYKS